MVASPCVSPACCVSRPSLRVGQWGQPLPLEGPCPQLRAGALVHSQPFPGV